MTLNHYQILEIPENASLDEIKSAFKKLAIKYHPDKHMGDPVMEERFKVLNSAYQTLSNPYSKHKYDMSLKFGSFDIPERPTPPPPPRYYQRPERPVYPRESITSKKNLIATLYAFLFAFVVGLIIQIGIWVVEYNRSVERERLLSERREFFGEALSAYDNGEIKESLLIIDDMGMFFESESDMREYKDMLLNNILTRAEESMKSKRYKTALNFYSILEKFPSGTSLNISLNKAEAHKQIGNYDQAIHIYQQLYMSGYRTVSFYIEMGDIYESGLKNIDKALEYYEKATKIATKDYESIFGKAYPVLVSRKYIPLHHYKLFMKLANAYYLTEKYESSLKSLVWTKIIWPDSSLNYTISGKCHQALGDQLMACKEFNLARKLGADIQIPSDCL
ncbi:MAG: DnaJ domain-containing protein [Cyclobacteriaceae bacterium]|jgi:curved DNA-binding protein CbpA|nr:DnaJ domain-containing protein [Cyclobacteriaceae bacterium]